MPSVTIRPNGAVVGFGPKGLPPGSGGNRGVVKGWSTGSARRLIHRLFEVRADQLPDSGLTFTGTIDRDLTYEEFHAVRASFVDALRRRSSLLTWVVEWTARGRPHVHCAVYGFDGAEHDLVLMWQMICRVAGFDPQWKAQHADEITGAVGWLAYLGKHAGRGVQHYQRQGAPPGWEKTGRLWGFNGPWPTQEPLRADVTAAFARDYRALLDHYVHQQRKSLGIKPPERGVRHAEEFRGISVWIPQEAAMVLLEPLIRAAQQKE